MVHKIKYAKQLIKCKLKLYRHSKQKEGLLWNTLYRFYASEDIMTPDNKYSNAFTSVLKEPFWIVQRLHSPL